MGPSSEATVSLEAVRTERQPIPLEERSLTEVDHLIHHRLPDGSYDPAAEKDIMINLTPAVQEAVMPYAVTETEHEYRENPETRRGTYMWLGKTAVQAAETGLSYHRAESALARVDVEVDEARYAEEDLRLGVVKFFISPRMTREDASLEVAKEEHLADEDSVRASWVKTDENGNITKRIMQSLLVRDIPLEAWEALLADPNNPFAKSIVVNSNGSALPIMQAHRELEAPMGVLREGPVSLVEAVVPYISDPALRKSVVEQLKLFRTDQEALRRQATDTAERWLEFEKELADSLIDEAATFEVKRFIISLQSHWGEKELSVIQDHQLPNVEFRMSRELADVVERAKRNVLWGSAGTATGNKELLGGMDPAIAEKIQTNERLIQLSRQLGYGYSVLQADTDRLVASQNLNPGGGCPGETNINFRNSNNGNGQNLEEDRDQWFKKKGICAVIQCKTRPGKTEVGPCSVCRSCQAKFDHGIDPTKTSLIDTIGKVVKQRAKGQLVGAH